MPAPAAGVARLYRLGLTIGEIAGIYQVSAWVIGSRLEPGHLYENESHNSGMGFAASVRILRFLTSESVLTLRYRRTAGDGNENRRCGLLGVLRGDGWASAGQPCPGEPAAWNWAAVCLVDYSHAYLRYRTEPAVLISANKRMEASDVAVSTDGAVEMQLERVDDLNLEIRYAGPGLEIRSVQVTCPDPAWQEEFTGATHAFLADGGELGLRRGKNRAGGPPRLACHGAPQ
jgi:hypothetical protein